MKSDSKSLTTRSAASGGKAGGKTTTPDSEVTSGGRNDGASTSQQGGVAQQELPQSLGPPPARTLLEFVAYKVLRDAVIEGEISVKEMDSVARAGYLSSDLSGIGDAVRRMQGDVVEAIKALDAGMVTMKKELEAEQRAIETNGVKSGSPVAGLQSAFNKVVEEQANGTTSNESNAVTNGDGKPLASSGEPQLSKFGRMLNEFMSQAEDEQRRLQALSQESQSAVSTTVAWLGEPPDIDALPVFQGVRGFAAEFDQAFAKMNRQGGDMVAAAKAAEKC